MLLDASTTSIVAVVGVGVGVVALVTGIAAHTRVRRLRRAYAALAGDAEHGDVLAAMERHLREVGLLRTQVAQLDLALGTVQRDLHDAIRHVAVVRYDAFQDMGGRLSYSVALLDDSGDGLVLTSINGRSETRTYAKGVKAGRSEHELSPEETQAVGFALRHLAAAGAAHAASVATPSRTGTAGGPDVPSIADVSTDGGSGVQRVP